MTNNIAAPIPQSANVHSRKDPAKDLLPSLTVKPDPTLKSCLSTASLNKSSSSVHHTTHPPDHPLFLIQDDAISPNKHGLVSEEESLSHTPSLVAGAANNTNASITGHAVFKHNPYPVPHHHLHAAAGTNNGNNISTASPASHNSPSSILSSAPNSPPPILPQSGSHAHTGISGFQLPQAGTPASIGDATGAISPPNLSRISSLRYVDSSSTDKKIIESANRQRTASPISTTSSPQLPPTNSGLKVEADEKKHLMIAITGCISIHKNIFLMIEKLFELYTHEKLEIQVILTKSAQWFLIDKLYKFEEFGVKVWFYDDGTKYFLTNKVLFKQLQAPNPPPPKLTANLLSQYVLAYELQKWTDVLLIAPLSANTMAKLINGLSDNLLTEMMHLWPIPSTRHQAPALMNNLSPSLSSGSSTVLTNNTSAPKSIIAALALTPSMYSHPITKRQLNLLQETYPNMSILKPVEKCVDVDGNISMGGMRSWREVVNFVVQKLGETEDDEDDDDDDDDDDDEEEEEEENDEVDAKDDGTAKGASHTNDATARAKEKRNGSAESEKRSEHNDTAGERLILRKDGKEDKSDADPSHRHRSDTVSNRELKEHEKIATINAMLNTGMSISSSAEVNHKKN